MPQALRPLNTQYNARALAIQSIKRRDCWHSIVSCALYLVEQDEIETAIQRLEELRDEIAKTIPENAEEIYADAAQDNH